jgi:Domain of unknown function (DUF4838)
MKRRHFLKMTAGASVISLARAWQPSATLGKDEAPLAHLRGLVLIPENLSLPDWPRRAKDCGLNTISLHHYQSPKSLCDFVATDVGQGFLAQCRDVGIATEFDYHAMRDLVPRDLFAKDPTLFRRDDKGVRTAHLNFCVHSKAALELAAENALALAAKLPTTTNCYYYWSDECGAWCRCSRCKELSDSEQPLVVENYIAAALRRERPNAQVSHLACHNSMACPRKIKPGPGVFLQFAPVRRRYDISYAKQREESQVDSLWNLERNLEVFSADSAQVLEYWLDATFMGGGKQPLPWNRERFLSDLAAYRSLGMKHIKSFGNGIDADYVKRHGEIKFLQEFADGLKMRRS